MNFRIFFISMFLIFLIGFSSAAHYIVGIVNDAKDGTPADDLTVTLWNPLNGLSDNLTDIVGVNGNSGTNNNIVKFNTTIFNRN